jgi:hypothetical protein
MKQVRAINNRLLRTFFMIKGGQPSETTKGRSAIVLARLMARVSSRWWMAQLPVILRGIILPRSVTKSLRVMGFL